VSQTPSIAVNTSIRDLERLKKMYGKGLLNEDEQADYEAIVKLPTLFRS